MFFKTWRQAQELASEMQRLRDEAHELRAAIVGGRLRAMHMLAAAEPTPPFSEQLSTSESRLGNGRGVVSASLR